MKEREKSEFLKVVDSAGRVVDFHGLRHTFISSLASGGVHPKIAQTLARHSSITLTMDRYTHLQVADRAATLAALPDLDRPQSDSFRGTGSRGQQSAS
jgi:integrase